MSRIAQVLSHLLEWGADLPDEEPVIPSTAIVSTTKEVCFFKKNKIFYCFISSRMITLLFNIIINNNVFISISIFIFTFTQHLFIKSNLKNYFCFYHQVFVRPPPRSSEEFHRPPAKPEGDQPWLGQPWW